MSSQLFLSLRVGIRSCVIRIEGCRLSCVSRCHYGDGLDSYPLHRVILRSILLCLLQTFYAHIARSLLSPLSLNVRQIFAEQSVLLVN